MSAEHAIVPVDVPGGSYPIHIGEGLLNTTAAQLSAVAPASSSVVLLSDTTVFTLYGNRVQQQLEAAGRRVLPLLLDPGESSKSFAVYEKLCVSALSWPIDRKTVLVALGGGVVGDLGGFMASTLLRGITFVQIPTTLLAQVDSSVGGKTAINCAAGKNLIGTFYQPSLVLIDTQCLSTLPLRERRAGYAEIIKYGLLGDRSFFDWCLQNGSGVLNGDAAALRTAISASCRAKALIVAADEKEAGVRALLNLGHTFAHALEHDVGFDGRLLHGEAVAFGLRLAARLSCALTLLPAADVSSLEQHLDALGYPNSLKKLVPDHTFAPDALLKHMSSDKKTLQGKKTFIILDKIGRAIERRDIADAMVLAILREA